MMVWALSLRLRVRQVEEVVGTGLRVGVDMGVPEATTVEWDRWAQASRFWTRRNHLSSNFWSSLRAFVLALMSARTRNLGLGTYRLKK